VIQQSDASSNVRSLVTNEVHDPLGVLRENVYNNDGCVSEVANELRVLRENDELREENAMLKKKLKNQQETPAKAQT